jgi:UDP-hydrolysing UDP-N-acetyl-D-glucosamine 2-epimerase
VRTIGVVTVGRSDYGIYRPVLRALRDRSDLEVALFVGEAHLLERFGRTVDEIELDAHPIAGLVRYGADRGDDNVRNTARMLGSAVTAFGETLADQRPDVLLVLGDRVEMLAAGVAALPLTIPVAHLHGGESSAGVIDDAARHALTKLSHLHFAATEQAARRIVQLGEEPWRVVVSGAPALDAITEFLPLTDGQLAERGVPVRGDFLLVTYHPVTLRQEQTREGLLCVLAAVEQSGLDAAFTYPNMDAGHRDVIDAVERFAASSERYTVVRNLGAQAYYTLMSRAAAMVGNSSSGIIEAASFRLPVVDVGDRQRGRLRAANVIHAASDTGGIGEAIAHAVSPDFRAALSDLVNPYGDGHASARIAERLATVPLDERLLVKRFHDLEPAEVGP